MADRYPSDAPVLAVMRRLVDGWRPLVTALRWRGRTVDEPMSLEEAAIIRRVER